MKSVRRLYIYLVTFISLEVVIWGLIGLLRTIFSDGLAFQGADTLSQALSLILVGIPIFGLHWFWAQRSASDVEEHRSPIRGVFLYGTLLATLIPVTQNILALINRNLILFSGINSFFSFVGGEQSTIDNVIAIVLNLIVSLYFYRILNEDSKNITHEVIFGEIYRLYGYIWVMYSLALALFGIQEIIRFIFFQPGVVIGPAGKEYFINGLSLCAVGLPIWVYSWNHRQTIDLKADLPRSPVRLVLLFILSLVGVTTVLTMASLTLNQILLKILGEQRTFLELISRIGNSISVATSLGIVWFYYGHWFNNEVDTRYEGEQARAVKRLRNYILSLIGLVATVVSLSLLTSFMIDVTTQNVLWGDTLRAKLAGAVATIISALPLWLIVWRPLQASALADNEVGSESRKSLIRRAYLYVAVFGAVIAGMVTAIEFVKTLLFGLLEHPDSSFIPSLLNSFALLMIFVIFLIYHLRALRADGAFAVEEDAKTSHVHTILVSSTISDKTLKEIIESVKNSKLRVEVQEIVLNKIQPDQLQNDQVIILSSSDLFENTTEKLLNGWAGIKFVLPTDIADYHWMSITKFSPKELIYQINNLNDDRGVRPFVATTAWQTVSYVLAVIFGLQILLVIFGVFMSFIFG